MPVLDSVLSPVEKDTIAVTDRKNVAFPRAFLFIAARAHTFRWLSHFLTEIEMYFQLLCALFLPHSSCFLWQRNARVMKISCTEEKTKKKPHRGRSVTSNRKKKHNNTITQKTRRKHTRVNTKSFKSLVFLFIAFCMDHLEHTNANKTR